MSTEIKFEVGKFYNTRAGGVVRLERIEGDDMPYLFSDGYWRHADGRLIHGTEAYRDIISEWTPDDEIDALERKRQALKDSLVAMEKELEAARKAKEEAERGPWEPKGGEWTVTAYANVVYAESVNDHRRAGSEYPTEKSAKAARDRIVFFRRLCALATELNPSGKVGGAHLVYWEHSRWRVTSVNSAFINSIDTLFETEEAAQRACEIMNRDKWEVPG